jgi:hypothetical protein
MTISLQSNSNWKDSQKLRFESLRPIAQKQIKSLIKRMELTHNRALYEDEIKKIISYEQNRLKISRL